MKPLLLAALLLCSGCEHQEHVCYVDELTPETAAMLGNGCDRVQTVGKVIVDDNVYYEAR